MHGIWGVGVLAVWTTDVRHVLDVETVLHLDSLKWL